MSRFVYIASESWTDVYDLCDGSLQTGEPSHDVIIESLNSNDTRTIRVWSAEALLEAIETYADSEGIRIREIAPYLEEQILKVVE